MLHVANNIKLCRVTVLFRQTRSLAERDVLLLNSISLVIYVCQVGCLATINFSFGFFLAIFTLPAYLLVRSTQNRYGVIYSFENLLLVQCIVCVIPSSAKNGLHLIETAV